MVVVSTTSTLPSQLSVAVTSAGAIAMSHDTVWSAGTPDRTGASSSAMVIWYDPVAVLPQSSMAVYTKVMTWSQPSPVI